MTIKGALLEVAFGKKPLRLASPQELQNLREQVEKRWQSPPPSPVLPELVGAVDGSRNKREFAGYVVYAIGAASIVFKRGKIENIEIDADIDILRPSEFSESRLRTLMGILEFKRALSVLSEVSVLFIDGSIAGAILRPSVLVNRVEEDGNFRSQVWEIFGELKKSYSHRGVDSKKFYSSVANSFLPENYAAACGYLEYLEYLYTIYSLLKTAYDSGKGIISVSKRSDSRHYFNNILPDIAILNSLDLPPGYLEPEISSIGSEEKHKFPGDFDKLLRQFKYSFSFIKLRDTTYKVETYGRISIEEALSYLNFYAVSGYPFPLSEVHRTVKISSSDFEEILRILGVRGITGREGLGE